MLQNITPENWKELYFRFPGLEGAMRAMAHKNELVALERGHAAARLNEWERARLDELRSLLWPAMEYKEASQLAAVPT